MIVLVAGTGTDVGKTFVAAALLRTLREHGISVAARKPVQSFAPGDSRTDADVLAAATGEDPNVVCPPHRRFPAAMAPPIAATKLGLPPFSIAQLAAEVAAGRTGPDAAALTLVESAGGVRSPLASDGDTKTLADAVHPAFVLLVADAGLGTINAVRMSTGALTPHPVVVFLNRFDPTADVHVANAEWLRATDGFETLTDPGALATFVIDRLRQADPAREA